MEANGFSSEQDEFMPYEYNADEQYEKYAFDEQASDNDE
jgi:hypothetical protein